MRTERKWLWRSGVWVGSHAQFLRRGQEAFAGCAQETTSRKGTEVGPCVIGASDVNDCDSGLLDISEISELGFKIKTADEKRG